MLLAQGRLERLIARMRFPKNFRVNLYNRGLSAVLHVEMQVEDSYNEGRMIWVGRDFPMPPYVEENEDEVFNFIRYACQEMVRHEMDEQLQVDGERRWDPHASR